MRSSKSAGKMANCVLETGYSEGGDRLRHDANMLLDGSHSRPGIVLTTDINCLPPGIVPPQRGYVEAWKWDKESNCKNRLDKQQVRLSKFITVFICLWLRVSV